MKRILTTTFAFLVSFLVFENINAQDMIPNEGLHMTITNINQKNVNANIFRNKVGTLDLFVENMDGQRAYAGVSWWGTNNYWSRPQVSGSNLMYEQYFPLFKPGEYYCSHQGFSETINFYVSFRSNPKVSTSKKTGLLFNTATQNGNFWVIESEKSVDFEFDKWFTGEYNEGTNKIYKDGILIGTNSQTYKLNGGLYKFEIHDGYEKTTTQIINIEIKTVPTVTKQPQNQNLAEEQTLKLSVEAIGGDLTYQWYKNENAISGATNANLTISNITIDDSGKYKCEIKNPRGSVFSNEASVTVTYKKPTITTQPTNKTLNETENLTLTIAADGKGISYQWQKSSANIAGATSATYYKANVNVNDAGEYQCLVTNSGGTVKSNLVKVGVNYNKPTITTQPKSQELTEASTLTLSVEASGSNLSYLWKKDNNVISGATNPTYTKPNVAKGDAGVYTCVVSNQGGSVTSTNATITIKNAAPVIQVQPQSQDLTVGSTLNLSVTAIGSELSYQWKKDGIPISGATSSSYTKNSISSSDEGSYICIVTNSGGLATSELAIIKIIITAEIPIFDGLKSEYSIGSTPITLKLTGVNSDKFKVFKVNGMAAIQFNPDKAGTYEIEALTEDGKSSISTYVIVK